MNKNVCRPTSACEPAHGIQDDKKPVEYHPVRVRLVTIIVTGICVLVNFTDGFDLVAMAVAAPLIAAEFALTPTILGFLFSAALVGMAVGAMVLSPLGDRVGRKRTLTCSVALVSVAMAATGVSHSLILLILLRFVTGVGVGGVLGSASSLVSEFAPEKFRSLLVIVSATGFTAGTVVVGPVASIIIEVAGWRGVFFAGAVLGALAGILVVLFLPESPEYLARSGGGTASTLNQVNRIRDRMGLAGLSDISPPRASKSPFGPGVGTLLSAGQRPKTLMIWGLLFSSFWTSYFLINWTPQLLVLAGFSLNHSIIALSLITFGGLVAAWLVGAVSSRWPLGQTITLLLIASVVVMVIYAMTKPTTPSLVMAAMFLVGFTVNGALTALYGLVAVAYPLEFRSTGIGWALGVGRLGAIASPVAGGFMVEMGIGMHGLLILLAVPMSAAGAVLAWLVSRQVH